MGSKLFVAFLFLFSLFPQKTIAQSSQWMVNSPDNKITATIVNEILPFPYPGSPALYYKIDREGQNILEYSPLGIAGGTTDRDFTKNLNFISC